MSHLEELMPRFDHSVQTLLSSQLLDPQNPRYGGFVSRDYHMDSRGCSHALSRVLLAYVCRESLLYLDPRAKTAIEAALAYMNGHLRPSGCVDLSGCNFDSAPDTAFSVNDFTMVWWLMEKRMRPELEWLRQPLLALLTRLSEGIVAGGFHTPNHRWIIAAALKSAEKITGRADFGRRADEYLSEGLDINQDGEFAERSAGTYNQLNDEMMLRLYMATSDPSFLEAARKNLTMMYAYLEPDGSLFTGNSTRQDNGVKMYPGSYYLLFLLTGYFLKDKSLAAMGEYCYRVAMSGVGVGHEPPFENRLLSAVPWLILFDGLEDYSKDASLNEDLLYRYNRHFAESGIARMREGNLTLTVMKDNPTFMYIQNGALSMYMVIHSQICSFCNFLPQKIEPMENGYRLTAHVEGWYYLPLWPEKPATTDWWAMDNPHTRKRMINVLFDTIVEATMADGGVDVRVRTEGYDGIPLRVEMGFTPCRVRHESFLMEGKPGSSLILAGGMLEMKGERGDVLTIEGGFAEHGSLARRDSAYPESPNHFTVYLTAYTPTDKRLRIGTKGFEQKDLLSSC